MKYSGRHSKPEINAPIQPIVYPFSCNTNISEKFMSMFRPGLKGEQAAAQTDNCLKNEVKL